MSSGVIVTQNNSRSSLAPLPNWAVLRFSGADAAAFMHAQLSNDIEGLGPEKALLAGYFSPKGRLLATLIMWRSPQDTNTLFALCPADIADSLVKRLSMFVFRLKVEIEKTPLLVAGLQLGSSDLASNTNLPEASALKALSTWQVLQHDDFTLIKAPAANNSILRAWVIAPETTSLEADDAGAALWAIGDIAAGHAHIGTETQELFLAQTLNLDLIGGVNFEKGCYPGQEIIARSHYRGTTKRRMAYGIADTNDAASTAPGSDIFNHHKPDRPCGRIINACTHNNQTHLLLEVNLSDLNEADFRLQSGDGTAIKIQALPYSIEAEPA